MLVCLLLLSASLSASAPAPKKAQQYRSKSLCCSPELSAPFRTYAKRGDVFGMEWAVIEYVATIKPYLSEKNTSISLDTSDAFPMIYNLLQTSIIQGNQAISRGICKFLMEANATFIPDGWDYSWHQAPNMRFLDLLVAIGNEKKEHEGWIDAAQLLHKKIMGVKKSHYKQSSHALVSVSLAEFKDQLLYLQ